MTSISSNSKLTSQYNVFGQKRYRNYDNGNTRETKYKTLTNFVDNRTTEVRKII